jgi:hypothetical protein
MGIHYNAVDKEIWLFLQQPCKVTGITTDDIVLGAVTFLRIS